MAKSLQAAAGPVRAALFKSAALETLSAAQSKAFRPILQRALAALEVQGADARRAALLRLQADLPMLAREVLKDDATGNLARAWESILAPAFLSGFAEAAQARQLGNPKTAQS